MKKHSKYPYQRVEERRNHYDAKGLNEQRQMQKMSEVRISIGVLSIFKPKPDAMISDFTLAFSKSVPKSKLYPKLEQAFDGHWEGEPTKSVFLHLSSPISMSELRKRIRESIEELLQPQNLKTEP